MLIPSLLLVALGWEAVQGSVIPRSHVVHEKRNAPPRQWVKRDRIGSEDILPMRIGLRQNNLENAEKYLMDVSHPRSSSYGKYLTSDEVIKLFAPSEYTVSSVRDWLVSHNISKERITHSDNQGWLAFDATTQEAEALLHTEYYKYEHATTGDVNVACDAYHVPKHITEHIDYVTPGLRLIPRSSLTKRGARKLDYHLPMGSPNIPFDKISSGVQDCDDAITPDCIAALYNIPPGKLSNESNAMGIYEFGDFYAQEDLDSFFEKYAPQIPNGTHPKPAFVDGATAPIVVTHAGPESSLDLQIAYPIIWPQGAVLFQSDDFFYTNEDPTITGIFNDFLDGIDGSYCTFSAYGETGNDPNVDPVYPDKNPGGYTGNLQCGVNKPTNVVSLSYGLQEADLPTNYQERQCIEFLKLGLQGTSVIFASGDSGVSGRYGCLGEDGDVFNPGHPVNCPYLTSVGATQIQPGKTVKDPETASSIFGSGGGFSNIFGTPLYQKDAADYYFKHHNPPYKSYSSNNSIPEPGCGLYNRIGRGMPDVAANGVNATIFVEGEEFLIGGTSQSAPTFAAIINRINEERIAIGKSTLGFLNPALYLNPHVFNDITSGSNPGCNTTGFSAVSGWDPVTGLGTPDYKKMLSVFLSFP